MPARPWRSAGLQKLPSSAPFFLIPWTWGNCWLEAAPNPPPPCPNGQGLGSPPNPSPLAKGQRLGEQGLSKWTRVGAPPTLHDLQMDKGCFNPSRLANGQRLGPPNPTTCKWTRVGPPPTLQMDKVVQMDKCCGPPNPSQLGAASKWTRVGTPPNPSRLANGQGLGAPMTGPFGPELPPNAKLKFCSWYNVWLWLGRIWFGWLDGLPRCE